MNFLAAAIKGTFWLFFIVLDIGSICNDVLVVCNRKFHFSICFHFLSQLSLDDFFSGRLLHSKTLAIHLVDAMLSLLIEMMAQTIKNASGGFV